jgi:ribonuclease VapC
VTGVVVDSSALMAILRTEPGYERVVESLELASPRLMAAPTAVELGMVAGSRTGDFSLSARLIRETGIQVVAFDERMAQRALDAFRRFGKGRHAAGLNFGDCCTYALAEERGLPLLCVGEDFTRTDLAVLP